MLQRQQQAGETADRACGGDGLRQRPLAIPQGVTRCRIRHAGPFLGGLFRKQAFLANLYRIAILYG
jgi:hypothetical protein